jgi:uncharacterized PurR-regulated membrane protein YhhQ (DUF165 family)
MLIILSMLFLTIEILSIIFNNFFYNINIGGYLFPFNFSVIFFCFGFFILDIITDFYSKKTANIVVYGKLLCQFLFCVLSYIAIKYIGNESEKIASILTSMPITLINSLIASLIGYKLTIFIMEKFKIYYTSTNIGIRYFTSALPGEIVFSFIFSLLSFSHYQINKNYWLIFLSLITTKFIFSIIFSLLISCFSKFI